MQSKSLTIFRQSGLSLIEIVISVGISSMLMLGLTTTFKNSSDPHRELEKSGMLIENGRYTIGLLGDDIKHAGFYGFFTISVLCQRLFLILAK